MFSQHISASPALGPDRSISTEYTQRISINQLTTLRSSLESDLKAYRHAGVPGIGLSCRKLFDYSPCKLAQLIARSEMQVSSLGWIGSFTGYNRHPQTEALQEARQMVKLAARLGAPVISVLSGPRAGHIGSHAMRLLRESLKQLLPLAETCKVQLAIMPVHPRFEDRWSFLTQLQQVEELIEEINHPRLGICFSTFHSCHERDLLSNITRLANRIKLVQIADWSVGTKCDNSRAMPGEGVLRLGEMVQTLESVGYKGWYELDVWCRDLWQRNPAEVIRNGLRAMRQLEPSTAEFPS